VHQLTFCCSFVLQLNCTALIPGSTIVNGTCDCAAPNAIKLFTATGNLTQCLASTTTACPTGAIAIRDGPGNLLQCWVNITACPPASGFTFALMSGNTLQQCRPPAAGCVYDTATFNVPLTTALLHSAALPTLFGLHLSNRPLP
jgi:hypothetical protein